MKASDLSLGKRIMFRIFGRVYLEHRQHEGWSGPNPFYLVNCPEHGLFELGKVPFNGLRDQIQEASEGRLGEILLERRG